MPSPTLSVVCPNTIREKCIHESSTEIYLVQKFDSVAEENKKLQGVLRAKSQTVKNQMMQSCEKKKSTVHSNRYP